MHLQNYYRARTIKLLNNANMELGEKYHFKSTSENKNQIYRIARETIKNQAPKEKDYKAIYIEIYNDRLGEYVYYSIVQKIQRKEK